LQKRNLNSKVSKKLSNNKEKIFNMIFYSRIPLAFARFYMEDMSFVNSIRDIIETEVRTHVCRSK